VSKHFAIAAALTALFSTTAFAADIPLKAPPPPPAPAFSWTGWYVGLNAGYGWGNPKDDVSTLPSPALFNEAPFTIGIHSKGFVGGGQLGYNWQSGPVVVGFEADISGAHISGTGTFGPIFTFAPSVPFPGSFENATETVRWLNTDRVRLGYTPTGQWLLYATGGVAVGRVSYSTNQQAVPGFAGLTFNSTGNATRTGWAAGGGSEWAINHNWSIKAEYLFFDLGHSTQIAPRLMVIPGDVFTVSNNFETRGNIVRAGINYKFQ
jgi:outer membrane immunogenic protein